MTNNYELDITTFFKNECPRDFSASVAEIGNDAGVQTWNAAKDCADFYDFLDNADKVENFKQYIRGFGAWEDSEIQSMTHSELNALLIQFIAGDIREAGLDQSPIDWEDYEQGAIEGRYSCRIYTADDHVYYSIFE